MPEILKLLFRENFVVIELDDGKKLSVSYETYSRYKLSSGMDVHGDIYNELCDESEVTGCRDKALNYLAVRARSVNEIEKYLRKKKFTAARISETIDYLKMKGYLNDLDFAVNFVKVKMKSGKAGADIIARDLYKKGIARETIECVIKECGADAPDMDKLYLLALKKFNTVKDGKNSLLKVANYLRQKGFDYESIKKVLGRLDQED